MYYFKLNCYFKSALRWVKKLFFAIIILKIMCYPGELNVVVGIIWNDLPGLFSGHPII